MTTMRPSSTGISGWGDNGVTLVPLHPKAIDAFVVGGVRHLPDSMMRKYLRGPGLHDVALVRVERWGERCGLIPAIGRVRLHVHGNLLPFYRFVEVPTDVFCKSGRRPQWKAHASPCPANVHRSILAAFRDTSVNPAEPIDGCGSTMPPVSMPPAPIR